MCNGIQCHEINNGTPLPRCMQNKLHTHPIFHFSTPTQDTYAPLLSKCTSILWYGIEKCKVKQSLYPTAACFLCTPITLLHFMLFGIPSKPHDVTPKEKMIAPQHHFCTLRLCKNKTSNKNEWNVVRSQASLTPYASLNGNGVAVFSHWGGELRRFTFLIII